MLTEQFTLAKGGLNVELQAVAEGHILCLE